MRPTVVKASQPNEFLALVPELVGFQPQNSVALVAFRGNRTCGALRFTLPDPGAPDALHKRIATTIVGMVCKIPGVDALVPVVYTDERFGSGDRNGAIPCESFARTLIRRCELSGFLVRDAFCVGSNGWGSYDDPECPAGGRPLSEIAARDGGGGRDADLRRATLGSLASWADLPDVAPSTRRDVASALGRLRRRDGALHSVPALVELTGGLLDPLAAAEVLLSWDPAAIDAQQAAALLFLVQSPANRDQIMLQLAFGTEVGALAFEVNVRYAALQRATGLSMDDVVLQEMERDEKQREEMEHDDDQTDAPAPSHSALAQQVSNLMMGLTPERPDPERIETALLVLKAVAALAPRTARPPVLCMLAWLSWALGRGSVAGIFIDQALQIDDAYGMATLLDTLFGTGHLPEWAYAVPADAHRP